MRDERSQERRKRISAPRCRGGEQLPAGGWADPHHPRLSSSTGWSCCLLEGGPAGGVDRDHGRDHGPQALPVPAVHRRVPPCPPARPPPPHPHHPAQPTPIPHRHSFRSPPPRAARPSPHPAHSPAAPQRRGKPGADFAPDGGNKRRLGSVTRIRSVTWIRSVARESDFAP